MAGRVQHARDKLGVVRGAAHQVAGADAVVVGDVELERVPVDLIADVGVATRAVADRKVVTQRTSGSLDEADTENRPAPRVERKFGRRAPRRGRSPP